jgi:tRNA-Thr(GGU) m(6)t(6)A37 methyltransferase TsaA
MPDVIATLYKVGEVISVTGDRSTITIDAAFQDAMLGIETMEYLDILFWIPLSRDVLQVHPRMDMDKPLRGVFSTRSPVRPNTIGVTRVRLVSREGLTIVVEGLDAFEGTAIIDIKEGGGTRHAI